MQSEKRNERACGVGNGTLPGQCAPLAFPYIPMQETHPERYTQSEALENGTLFPGLNLPFKRSIQATTKLRNTALVELMALDFAIEELGLYLDTHADDWEALQLYLTYVNLVKEGRVQYQKMHGPLFQTDVNESGYTWLNNPWPWEEGGNS